MFIVKTPQETNYYFSTAEEAARFIIEDMPVLELDALFKKSYFMSFDDMFTDLVNAIKLCDISGFGYEVIEDE